VTKSRLLLAQTADNLDCSFLLQTFSFFSLYLIGKTELTKLIKFLLSSFSRASPPPHLPYTFDPPYVDTCKYKSRFLTSPITLAFVDDNLFTLDSFSVNNRKS
jgi:hypothetical protein